MISARRNPLWRSLLGALLFLPATVWAAGFTLTPASTLPFGNVVVGANKQLTVSVNNNGGTALSGFAVTSSNTAQFAVTNGCGTAIANGATCTVTVTFTPSAVASATATLSFRATGVTTKTVAASGAGVAGGVISVTPTSLAFGNQTTNTSATKTFVLTNASTNGGRLSGITFTAPTGFTVSGCTATLIAGASCTATVTFRPTSASAYSGSIKITSALATNSGGNFVAVSGTGVAPAPVITPSVTSLALPQTPVNTTSTATFTIRNTGTAALSGVNFTSPTAFTATGCVGTIAINASCTVTVSFRPTAAQTYSGNLVIKGTNAAQVSVFLSGTGYVPTPVLTIVQPASLSYLFTGTCTQSVQPAPLAIIAQNTGNGPLTFSSVSLSGAGFAISNGCPVSPGTLAAAGVCSVTVNYTGKSSTLQTATVTLNSNGGNKVINLSASCSNPASP